MSASVVLRDLGGVARRGVLERLLGRAELDRAIDAGEVVRTARGVYALPEADAAVRLAHELGGQLSLTSAALHHGWAVKTVPQQPHIIVPRWRKLPAKVRAQVHWTDRPGSELATPEELTLEQCLRTLPFDEALAVADSALRAGFGAQALARIADAARGPGALQVRRVAELASRRPANPFESVLRAIAADVPGLCVQPQITIRDGAFTVRPDLVDERLRIVLEADSFEWHGSRDALVQDAQRYNMLVVAGWLVLRFTYEDVMFHPDDVRRTLTELMGQVRLGRRPAA